MAQLNLQKRAIYIQLLELMLLKAAVRVTHYSESCQKILRPHTKLLQKCRNVGGLQFIWLNWVPLIQK